MPFNQHTKQWKSLTKRAKKWITKSGSDAPSFVIMYLKPARGVEKHQIVWEGAQHMMEFAKDPVVIDKFLQEAVYNRSIVPKAKPRDANDITIKLPCMDPRCYQSRDLQRIIPVISNPHGTKFFWSDARNMPRWWPSKAKNRKKKGIPFKSPNHPGKGSKLTAAEMRRVLREFLKDCKEQYEIVQQGEASKMSLPESSSGMEESSTDGDMDATNSEQTNQQSLMQPDQPSSKKGIMSVESALSDLEASKSEGWNAFSLKIAEVSAIIDWNVLIALQVKSSREIPQCYEMDSKRKTQLRSRIPSGYHIFNSTGQGNCLYCSVSISLNGDETLANLMRLASVIHAASHIDHYIQMYKVHIEDAGMALQFLATVSTESTFNTRPTNEPSVEDLLLHTFREEIMNTSILNFYSGPLQVQFLAGTLKRPITQEIEDVATSTAHSIYRLVMLPCHCCENQNEMVGVFWMRISEAIEGGQTPPMNHIAPLIPESTTHGVQARGVVLKQTIAHVIDDVCIMSKLQKCCVRQLLKSSEDISWVICQKCHAWYHCICVGISEMLFEDNGGELQKEFVCCHSQEQQKRITGKLNTSVILQYPPKCLQGAAKKSLSLVFTDIHSLYPGNGLSDGIIDFYKMTKISNSNDMNFVSALTYNAIVDIQGRKHDTLQNKKKAYMSLHQSLNKDIDLLSKPMVGFPCKLTECWHWILVVVNTQTLEALVYDSMQKKVDYYLSSIADFLSCVLYSSAEAKRDESLMLKAKFIPVSMQQNNTDCGVHVLHNMSIIADEIYMSSPQTFLDPPDTKSIRANVLAECYRQSTEFYEHVRLTAESKPQRPVRTKDVQAEKLTLINNILYHVQDGLKAVFVGQIKGYGVVTTKAFKKGQFLCEYAGDLLNYGEAQRREEEYASENSAPTACYLYYFRWKEMLMCVDATEPSSQLGRLINHGHIGNISTKLLTIENIPHLYFTAQRDIAPGEELYYNYGDHRKKVVEDYPWLATK